MENIDVKDVFKQLYGKEVEAVYKAPARINLIGEHIDYNGGLVFPSTIGIYTKCYFSKRDDKEIHLCSLNKKKAVTRNLDDLSKNGNSWENYPIGAVYTLARNGFKIEQGFNMLFTSEIPMGSGLSSSAAILDLTIYTLKSEYNFDIDNKLVSLIAWETENKYCGLSCGIMDQAIIALGKKNHAMLLDCYKYKYDYFPFDLGDYSLLVLKTNKPRTLTDSKYNERVRECDLALDKLKEKFRHANNLCEYKMEEMDEIKKVLNDDLLYRRVLHVVSENKRVSDFKDALLKNDLKLVGKLLNESHFSLKDNYEVTGEHLDTITKLARENKGCLGARMTGAGFGGCAIAIVKKDSIEEFKKTVISGYSKALGITCDIFECEIPDGVSKE
ncbi:MAG: galactokinase [Acholeplasmatales bacterium]|nr:galactokinase [Acholeplasmatales bacterium]